MRGNSKDYTYKFRAESVKCRSLAHIHIRRHCSREKRLAAKLQKPEQNGPFLHACITYVCVCVCSQATPFFSSQKEKSSLLSLSLSPFSASLCAVLYLAPFIYFSLVPFLRFSFCPAIYAREREVRGSRHPFRERGIWLYASAFYTYARGQRFFRRVYVYARGER